MIRRQHIERNFFSGAEAMRQALEVRFKDAYTDSIPWYYFCDPSKYTYLRTSPQRVFQQPLFDNFMQRLRHWCMEQLGLTPMGLPYLHLMVDGCRLGLHSDFHNGAWGYVYSLTHWDRRTFSGGETLLLRDGVPSYKKHHVHGDVLYELVPAQFNQLLIFDDRIVHATPTVEGSMDPLDGRIAMVGHIRATAPIVRGAIKDTDVRKVFLEALPNLRERIRSYKDVQGTITFRLAISPMGAVETATILTDNIVTPVTGYDRSDAVTAVKSIIEQTMAALRFPATAENSEVIVPLLIPLPDLRPIEFVVPHDSSHEAVCEWAVSHLGAGAATDLRGNWEGDTFVAREPIAGRIRIEPRQISVLFDPPMWVPSQRESFQTRLLEWAKGASHRHVEPYSLS